MVLNRHCWQRRLAYAYAIIFQPGKILPKKFIKRLQLFWMHQLEAFVITLRDMRTRLPTYCACNQLLHLSQ